MVYHLKLIAIFIHFKIDSIIYGGLICYLEKNCMINQKILNQKMADIRPTHDKDLLAR